MLFCTADRVDAMLSPIFSMNSISCFLNSLNEAISITPKTFSSILSGTISNERGVASPSPDVISM